MKSYTDIEQSRKLAEILPVESADMEYILEQWIDEKTHRHKEGFCEIPVVKVEDDYPLQPITIPCWSLAALLSLIKPINENTYTLKGTLDGGAFVSFEEATAVVYQDKEIIDAVYEMIIWLYEKKLL